MSADTITLLVSIVSLIVTAVWAVGRISKDTAVLNATISHLSANVDRLTRKIDHLYERTDNHEGRLIRLEAMAPPKQG